MSEDLHTLNDCLSIQYKNYVAIYCPPVADLFSDVINGMQKIQNEPRKNYNARLVRLRIHDWSRKLTWNNNNMGCVEN